jgi:hypothetical protein
MYKRPDPVPGQWFIRCDRTGFRLPSAVCQFEWNNLLTWERVWEPRQPQDYLRGIPDNMSVPYGRPNQDPTFLNYTVTPADL